MSMLTWVLFLYTTSLLRFNESILAGVSFLLLCCAVLPQYSTTWWKLSLTPAMHL